MDRSLTSVNIAGIEMTEQLPLVNSGNLLGEERRMAMIVVYAGQPEQNDRNVAVLFAD